METRTSNLETALDAANKGIVCIPFHPGTKNPAVKWKQWQTEMPPESLIRDWFKDTRMNIAIITTGMVVFDCDDPEKAELVLKECGETPHRIVSPRGYHFGYRRRKGVQVHNSVNVKGLDIDIRTDGGLELLPHSKTEFGRYEWDGDGLHPVSELPVAKISWTRERTKRVIQSTIVPEQAAPGTVVGRGQLYVDEFEQRAFREETTSNGGGHTALFVAGLKIVSFVRKLGGTEHDAWALFLYFNQKYCVPPWDLGITAEARAMEHKFRDALRLAR